MMMTPDERLWVQEQREALRQRTIETRWRLLGAFMGGLVLGLAIGHWL